VHKGGTGNDAIDAGPGLDIIMGGEGKDFTNGGLNSNETFAGEGDDFVLAGDGPDTVFGGGGDDWQEGGNANDLLQGDSGAPFFDLTEALSGWDKDDVLKGDDAVPLLQDVELRAPWGSNALTMEGIARIKGLDAIVARHTRCVTDPQTPPAEGEGNPTPPGPPATVCGFGVGNILIGGAGSDLIQGRGADDLIDGDKWLNVRLSVRADPADPATETRSANSMTELAADVFAGRINPGNIVIVREILSNPGPNDVDTAVYSGARADYDITFNADSITVAHLRNLPPCCADQGNPKGDGTDTLRNIERLQFSDQVVELRAPDAPAIGTATASNAQATVRWTAPANTGGGPLTGYDVLAFAGTGTDPVKTATAPATATSVTVTGLANGTSYTFKVLARNGIGASAPSAASNAVVPAPQAPDAPTIGVAGAAERLGAGDVGAAGRRRRIGGHRLHRAGLPGHYQHPGPDRDRRGLGDQRDGRRPDERAELHLPGCRDERRRQQPAVRAVRRGHPGDRAGRAADRAGTAGCPGGASNAGRVSRPTPPTRWPPDRGQVGGATARRGRSAADRMNRVPAIGDNDHGGSASAFRIAGCFSPYPVWYAWSYGCAHLDRWVAGLPAIDGHRPARPWRRGEVGALEGAVRAHRVSRLGGPLGVPVLCRRLWAAGLRQGRPGHPDRG
jgi:Ca2+-binding RTX toxin-like protein